MFSFENFQFLEGFLKKILSTEKISFLFVHISKFPKILKDWKAASVFWRLEIFKCLSVRAWNCFNVS